MFTPHKLKEILMKHQKDPAKTKSITPYSRVNMNQPQSINAFNKFNKVNPTAGNVKRTTGKAFMIQDGIMANDKSDYEFDTRKHYDTNDDNNVAFVASSVVTMRKSKTPIESMNLNASAFSIFKPNKGYVAENPEEEVYNNVDDTFHRAISPSQWFALLPVRGVLYSNPKRLKFTIKSLPVVWSAVFMAASSVLTMTMLKHLLKIGINAKNFVGLVFFGCVQLSCILFISLATRWPKIMRYWHRIETIFTQKPYEIPKRNIAWRVRLAAYVIILLSVVEHGLYLCSAIYSYRLGNQLCATVYNTTGDVSFGEYVHRNYEFVFQILPFNLFVAIFILIVNGACTFIWNYMDMFIMMVSKGIAYRFEQITTRINKLANKEVPESVFIEIREHYVKLCELLEYIDENLSGIILLSCINNLYFVCYQLLNVFNKLRWPINYIYFWYSLLYLIGRTAYVFLAAASINDESMGGLAVLRRVSSRTWCVEVERLIFQMTTQTVALSGKKFYFLTRRLLFGMAGTIVTYELVLLQFDEPNRLKGLPALCG